MRIDKLLSNLQYGSRSDIKDDLKHCLVKVNGKIILDPKTEVKETDEITYDEEIVFHKENIYLMMNKPKDYICANRDGLHKTVLELVPEPYNRYSLIIVGRLDIDTEGLLLLTNDGAFAHEITSPRHEHYKKYQVTLRNPLGNFDSLLKGVTILDGENKPYVTKEASIEPISEKSCFISICEGKFHQVKRMFEAISNEVVALKRVSINNLELGDLPLGRVKEIRKNALKIEEN